MLADFYIYNDMKFAVQKIITRTSNVPFGSFWISSLETGTQPIEKAEIESTTSLSVLFWSIKTSDPACWANSSSCFAAIWNSFKNGDSGAGRSISSICDESAELVEANDPWKPKILVENRILFQNRNFSQKSKFWVKIEFLVENGFFAPEPKFCSKIDILVKNLNFGRQSKFWSKIEILVEDRNFSQTKILVENGYFGQKSKCTPTGDLKDRSLVFQFDPVNSSDVDRIGFLVGWFLTTHGLIKGEYDWHLVATKWSLSKVTFTRGSQGDSAYKSETPSSLSITFCTRIYEKNIFKTFAFYITIQIYCARIKLALWHLYLTLANS